MSLIVLFTHLKIILIQTHNLNLYFYFFFLIDSQFKFVIIFKYLTENILHQGVNIKQHHK